MHKNRTAHTYTQCGFVVLVFLIQTATEWMRAKMSDCFWKKKKLVGRNSIDIHDGNNNNTHQRQHSKWRLTTNDMHSVWKPYPFLESYFIDELQNLSMFTQKYLQIQKKRNRVNFMKKKFVSRKWQEKTSLQLCERYTDTLYKFIAHPPKHKVIWILSVDLKISQTSHTDTKLATMQRHMKKE